MTPEEIDRVLTEAARRSPPQEVDAGVVQRAKASVVSSLQPVRPLASSRVFLVIFFILFAAVAALGAVVFGVRGFPVLSGVQRAVIFPLLVAAAAMAAIAAIREMRPAGGRRIGSLTLALSVLVPLAAFAFLFRNYDPGNFVPDGVKCLTAGLACAIPAAIVAALVLRRGFVLHWPAAGIASGTLAGLAGIAMLELHCPILKAPHIMVWHVAVVWISGLGGWLVGWIAQRSKHQAYT
jgi:hypothetical protein